MAQSQTQAQSKTRGKTRGKTSSDDSQVRTVEVSTSAFSDSLLDLMEQASQGDRAASRTAFAELEKAGQDAQLWYLVEQIGDLGDHAADVLIKRTYGEDEFALECGRRKVKKLQKELAGSHPSPLEKLLAERIAVCWIDLYYRESMLAQDKGNSPLVILEYRQKQLDRAHKRYLSAIKTLAQVRKLQLPTVQVNIGEKQVNVGQINGVPTQG